LSKLISKLIETERITMPNDKLKQNVTPLSNLISNPIWNRTTQFNRCQMLILDLTSKVFDNGHELLTLWSCKPVIPVHAL